jgi:hypothetical protein
MPAQSVRPIVFVVDDDTLVRDVIEHLLESVVARFQHGHCGRHRHAGEGHQIPHSRHRRFICSLHVDLITSGPVAFSNSVHPQTYCSGFCGKPGNPGIRPCDGTPLLDGVVSRRGAGDLLRAER